ncbi:MAG: prolyl oligopeptidase family serine peptidase [Candidatus Hydrogenedentes bacterium]|nr:prolyl oligopeptidase family serine peptidase [Candidatus Hydrogenedentota bacterium]
MHAKIKSFIYLLVLCLGSLLALADAPEPVPPAVAEATAEEFPVAVDGTTITVRVLTPPANKLAKNPALFMAFAVDRNTTLTKRPYCLAAEYFLENGHRALSFDLPSHGDRVGALRSGIDGFRDAFVAGNNVFAGFVWEGKAVIDECIKRGLATPGRIAVGGTSRGGYMSLRLLAGDDRIVAGAGFAPVTDWRDLREFSEDKTREDVAALYLSNFIPALAGKHVFVAIGKTDERVSTAKCQAFAESLQQANTAANKPAGTVDFHLTDDAGHSLSDTWYEKGRAFLLQSVALPSP